MIYIDAVLLHAESNTCVSHRFVTVFDVIEKSMDRIDILSNGAGFIVH